MSQEFWDERYRERAQIWSGRPNQQLVSVVGGAPRGRALDLGCGEGADAVWLARQGWQVTAVDVAPTALERAAQHAREEGVASRITFQQRDLAVSLPEGRFDLVSAQFLQSPVDFPREEVLRRAAACVEEGGLLLVVDHAEPPPWSRHAHQLPSLQETLATLALPDEQWAPQVAEVRERTATGPDGASATLRDNVLALRRKAG